MTGSNLSREKKKTDSMMAVHHCGGGETKKQNNTTQHTHTHTGCDVVRSSIVLLTAMMLN